MKHTPGPWHVLIEEDEDNEFTTRTIMSSDNRDRNLSEVALMTTGSFDDDTEAANARLVASAPELLKVCEAIVSLEILIKYPDNIEVEHTGEAEAISELIYIAKEAIKKATA